MDALKLVGILKSVQATLHEAGLILMAARVGDARAMLKEQAENIGLMRSYIEFQSELDHFKKVLNEGEKIAHENSELLAQAEESHNLFMSLCRAAANVVYEYVADGEGNELREVPHSKKVRDMWKALIEKFPPDFE